MSNSFNGVRLGSDHDDDENDNHLDDHDDDDSKEHTGLLQQESSGNMDRDSDRAINRRNGNRSMVHSLYASPKHSVSQRRQASVPGSPIHEEPHSSRGAAPLFMNNVAGLWSNDTTKDQDSIEGDVSIGSIHRRNSARGSASNSRPSSSLILDDVTPPLPWKEPTDQYASTNRLSASQRFSMDAIADGGAFAMPSSQPSLSDSQSLQPSTFTESPSIDSSPKLTPASTLAEPKKRRWGPKSQKAAALESVVPEAESTKVSATEAGATPDKGASFTKDTTDLLFNPHSYDSPSTTAAVTIPSTPISDQSSLTQNKVSQSASSTFAFSALSGTGRGLVSGLTSLKNSIMIPALSSAPSTATPTNSNNRGPKTTSPPQQQQQHLQKQPRRKRVASQNSAATHSLSTYELELQQQIQRQGQLSAHKIELCKELLSLYSRRNSNEQRQEEAVKAERFEEADATTMAIVLVQERISQLEGIYADTDRSLWECKKRQDELGRKICEFHPLVLREMDEMRLKREADRDQFGAELKQQRESEVADLQSERDEIEKDRSDIALEQDFLGKTQGELKERIDEETRFDQDELDDLREKRKANRSEIEELTRKLEKLHQQDKTWALEIATVQQRIRSTEEQFGEKTKEAEQDKQKLDHRIADLQKRSQNLDRQESQLQKLVEEGEVIQGKIQSEIQAIISQQENLESVRKMFGDEMAIIQRLRSEEESFREKEAGWSMRASRWTQDQIKLENKIRKLTDKVSADQRAVVELGEAIEGMEKRIGQAEPLKVLAVQRRDFKQASYYSGELTRLRETMGQQREELERRTGEMASGSMQKDLEGLQKEYNDLKVQHKQEQLDLFKEIEMVTTDTLARLAAACSKPTSNGISSTSADKSTTDAKDAKGVKDVKDEGSRTTVAGVLLLELRSEIESVLDMSRIRFGREATAPGTTCATITESSTTAARTIPSTLNFENKEEQKATLERDIQAAVAEEDYAAAAELQERLEAL
ncbi:hypothetical protein BGX29_003117 [Mortierella sp. GBA35]|nr:hypothetical protein BGX29_003117 [Mortierella sp. GBA35]